MKRLQFKLQGQIQGVGFRPTVYRVANELGLTGFVLNDARGVTVEVQGKRADQFIGHLKTNLPLLAKIDSVKADELSLKPSEGSFNILKSANNEPSTARISPDVSICPACLKELFDRNSRYYLYPFLNCTDCGPRLTITQKLPYDRAQTSMGSFTMCDDCKKEYADPNNRRYHAQPTACEKCGPTLSETIVNIVEQIKQGKIVAVKSVGGYQLICDATNQETVKKLRRRKERDSKPFALMTLNIQSAKKYARLSLQEKQLLKSAARPIVLLPKHPSTLTDDIAVGLSEYGIMLPCSPIHYLLFHGLLGSPDGSNWLDQCNDLVLVATSANHYGEPLITDDIEAKKKLNDIADVVVSYNREIVARADDSVVRVIHGAPFYIRRARGYVPVPIKLAKKIPSGIAVGAHLKNTICITRNDEAFVSQYLGDMDSEASVDFFHETLSQMLNVLEVKPEFIVHDLHPDFYTTQFASSYGLPSFAIQHHHAHLLSVAAEHHVKEVAIGLALDGYGYGADGGLWGGELLLLDSNRFERLGSLKEMPQPGGDVAAREPWRMAVAILHELNRHDEIKKRFHDCPHLFSLEQHLSKGFGVTMTSSCGRLFDAASALLGVAKFNHYEGEAAMRLESLVTKPKVFQSGWVIINEKIDFMPLLAQLLTQGPIEGANIFHGTLIAGLSEWIIQNARKQKIKTVLLSGGCFLNKILTEGLLINLRSHGLKPLVPYQLPPNDAGISLGQVEGVKS